MTTLNRLVCISMLLVSCLSNAQSFYGTPKLKISESGLDRVVERIDASNAPSVACEIREIDGKYYWATRGGKQLVKIESGAFEIYVDATGGGYIKVVKPELKNSVAAMSNTEKQFDYIEHLTLGLRTVTYWGNKR